MGLDRKWVTAAASIAAVLFCVWCSALSGIAGWVVGGDIAARETRMQMGATATVRADLPPLGVLVTRLDREGPAARAGVLRGDVIVAIDGAPLADARDLRDALLHVRPGDRVRLTVERERSELTLTADLIAFPDNPQRAYLGIYFTARAEEPADL